MKALLPALLLALAPSCHAQASAPRVIASLTALDSPAVEVSYQLPPGCTALSFLNDGIAPDAAAAIRKDWTSADACTLIDSAGVRPARAECTSLRVRAPASKLALDRIYPWAFPLARGMYVHTMAYAVGASCGAVDWRFAMPGGTVVLDGVVAGASGQRNADQGGGNHLPVVLLRGAASGSRLHIDAGFTPQGEAFLKETMGAVERALGSMLPGLPMSLPYTVATVAPDGETWGDIANQTTMRLHLAASPKPEQRAAMSGFLAHELAHLVQPKADGWNDVWADDAAMLGEGGAELLRWVVSAKLGWADAELLRRDLERAVNSCVMTAAGASWLDTRQRGGGSAPYDCGLTLHLIGLVGGKGEAPPLQRLRDYYQAVRKGERTDFAAAVECGASAGCTPKWLGRLRASEPVEAVLADYAATPGAILRPGPWSPQILQVVRRRFLGRLMQLDCDGRIQILAGAAAVRVGSGLQCRSLREGMEIVRAEGLSLFDGVAALQASARACAERGRTVLGLKTGTEVVVACNRSAYVPSHLFYIDMEKALPLIR